MPRCAWCGAPRQQCYDPAYVPGDASARQKSASRPYQEAMTSAPWNSQNHVPTAAQWNQGQQPNFRPRSRRRGRGRNHQQQQTALQAAPLPMPPPVPVKGDGKGFGAAGHFASAILAPPPPPAAFPAPAQPAPSSMPMPTAMQTMPIAGGDLTAYAPTPAQPSEAEIRLQSLLKELRQAPEESLTPGVQAELHKNAQRDDKIMNKGLETAVKELGHARRAVSAALALRTKLVSDWKVFLQQSVLTWKEYTSMFQAQEMALQEKLKTVQEALVVAKRNFNEQSQALKEEEIKILTPEDRDSAPVPDADMQSEATKRIHEGLTEVVTSLQSLSEQAEVEEQKTKRQKKSEDEADEAEVGGPSQYPSMQPFGKPDNK